MKLLSVKKEGFLFFFKDNIKTYKNRKNIKTILKIYILSQK